MQHQEELSKVSMPDCFASSLYMLRKKETSCFVSDQEHVLCTENYYTKKLFSYELQYIMLVSDCNQFVRRRTDETFNFKLY